MAGLLHIFGDFWNTSRAIRSNEHLWGASEPHLGTKTKKISQVSLIWEPKLAR
jgi:hypothetical protein